MASNLSNQSTETCFLILFAKETSKQTKRGERVMKIHCNSGFPEHAFVRLIDHRMVLA